MRLFAHRDSTIVLINNGKSVTLPIEKFSTIENYSIPKDFIQREYQPGVMHVLIDASGNQTQLDRAWEEGDRYLAKIANYQSVAAEFSTAPPPEPDNLSLEEFKELRVRQLSNDCNASIASGFSSDALGKMHHYDGSLESQTNLLGAVALAEQIEEPVALTCTEIETGNKQPRPHTLAQLQKVFETGCTSKTSKIAVYHQLKAQIHAAKTKEAARAVVWADTP